MKGKFFKTFFISFLIFALIWSGFIYKTVIKAESDVSNSGGKHKESFIDRFFDSKDDITFLVLGVDSNDSMQNSNTRSDTMMVCRADKETGNISILSIPRDTKARIRGRRNEEKINHAYAYGGSDLAMKAVKDLLGIKLDYYLTVDYRLVEEYVNLIGGVDVYVPMDMNYSDPVADPPLYINLREGQQALNGDEALQFLRFRKGYADQDLGRIRSQQQFVESAIKKTLSPGNIVKIPQMIKTYYDNVNTNIPLDLISKFAIKANNFDMEEIEITTLPGEGSYINGISYFIMDEIETNRLLETMFFKEKVVRDLD